MDNLLRGLVNWVDNWLYYPSRASTGAPSIFGFSPAHSFLFRVGPGFSRRCPPLPAPVLIITVGRQSIPRARCPPALPFTLHHRPLALKSHFSRAHPQY